MNYKDGAQPMQKLDKDEILDVVDELNDTIDELNHLYDELEGADEAKQRDVIRKVHEKGDVLKLKAKELKSIRV